MKNDRKLFNLGLQILCPKDLLVLVLSPLGGSGDETDWDRSCWARQKGTRNEILESFRLEDENDYEYEIWL